MKQNPKTQAVTAQVLATRNAQIATANEKNAQGPESKVQGPKSKVQTPNRSKPSDVPSSAVQEALKNLQATAETGLGRGVANIGQSTQVSGTLVSNGRLKGKGQGVRASLLTLKTLDEVEVLAAMQAIQHSK